MDIQEKISQIAISQVKGVGQTLANRLIAYFGSAQAIFQSSPQKLTRALRGHSRLVDEILNESTVIKADTLLSAHNKVGINIITRWEEAYPERLKHAYGAPNLLYLRGNADLNQAKVISIVGTRRATSYGKRVVETLLSELSNYPLLLVSGLAYGIDIHAHRTALELGLPTLAVLAGGLDTIYPTPHKKVAEAMLSEGGLLSEHPLESELEVHQFVARNRIIAGVADATIVVEAGQKSGALITANYANDYNREVFAVAGSIYDPYSTGCHQLIKTHQANLLTSADDIICALNWDQEIAASKHNLLPLNRLPELTEPERGTVQTIDRLQKEVHIDELSYQTQIPLNQLAATLFQLELKQIVKPLPGNKFRLVAC
ncbi:MAG: DNA-processing protein DprA [Bacteroidota bacterium]